MRSINNGSRGGDITRLQQAINSRLRARSAGNHAIKPDGNFGPATRKALTYALYLLGYDADMIKKNIAGRTNAVSPREQMYVLNPGRRTDADLRRGRKRVAAHRKAVKKQEQQQQEANAKRQAIVRQAEQAAANYRQNPRAYHYLAGGVANLIFLRPSPRNYRSDCSQFAASVYKAAGLPSPASVPHEWASTYTMVKSPHAKVTTREHRKPGDLGMYGSLSAPHHVEIWCGNKFIGHGSPPIDSLTPGEPDYYLTFDFLN
jgi:hypothetical protein